MPKPLLAFLLLLTGINASAQDYITPSQYAFQVDSNLVYGSSTDYLGHVLPFALDLYKPLGNTDVARPLMVLVHGGTWLAGCKNDVNSGVVALARQFAARGYVVASLNYRLGWHKAGYVANPAGPPIWPEGYLGLYPADSLEIVRALYRAQQDVKGAIRWLKAPSDIDSTCIEKVFVGGESAGGFNAMAAAFLDRPEEKPASCNALPDAPIPAANLLNQTGYGCATQTWPITAAMLQRPDLGPVEGTMNLNGFDAHVQAVLDLFGGVPTDAYTLDWWQGVDTPAVYLFHQSCDGVVPFNSGRPYGTMANYCNLGATPWHYQYPIVRGGNYIFGSFQGMAEPPVYSTDFTACDAFNPDIALFDCIRYADNGAYHFLPNPALRAVHIAAFLEPMASVQSCLGLGVAEARPLAPHVFPQPATDRFSVIDATLRGTLAVQLIATDGRILLQKTVFNVQGDMTVDLNTDIPNGIYVLRFNAGDEMRAVRVMVQRCWV